MEFRIEHADDRRSRACIQHREQQLNRRPRNQPGRSARKYSQWVCSSSGTSNNSPTAIKLEENSSVAAGGEP